MEEKNGERLNEHREDINCLQDNQKQISTVQKEQGEVVCKLPNEIEDLRSQLEGSIRHNTTETEELKKKYIHLEKIIKQIAQIQEVSEIKTSKDFFVVRSCIKSFFFFLNPGFIRHAATTTHRQIH